jgi:hypothetical protein
VLTRGLTGDEYRVLECSLVGYRVMSREHTSVLTPGLTGDEYRV